MPELQHYGILGMKWGVRRTPEQLGYDRKKKAYTPHTIKKGTKFYRVSAKPGDANGPTYVTMLPPDRDFYRGVYSKRISKQQGGDGRAYETTYKSNRDLKIANRKDMMDEFSDFCKNEKDTVKELLIDYSKSLVNKDVMMGRITTATEGQANAVRYVNKYLTHFGDLTTGEQYMALTRGLTVSVPKAREKFIENLKKKGFDGYIDEAGVGGIVSPREGVEPLVIFDAEKNLDKKASSFIDYYTKDRANERYQQWFKAANSEKNQRKGEW